ncbi:MAG: hypothetical protein ACO1QR_15345 [Chthoniobacteraceae bacterium]
MMLAAIPGELIGLVIFAVAALLKWLGDRATEQEASKTPRRSAEARRQAGAPASATSWEVDQERKRKFMEALGLPTDDLPPKRETPMVLRPEAQSTPPALPKPSATPPIPPFVYREERQKRKKQRKVPPPMPAVVVAEPAPPVAVVLPVAPAVPQASGFELHRDISGTERVMREGDPRDTLVILREELGRQDTARRAFLLREILGPPPGLQMPGSVPSFRSP